jgi:aminopeptidase N
VASVLINGRAANYQLRNAKLFVAMDDQQSRLKKLRVRCYYAVPFRENGISLVYWKGLPTIHTYGLPYTAKEWWPCKDLPCDKADSADIFITVPRPFTAVSNGKLMTVKSVPGLYTDSTEQQFHWKVSYPIYPDVISLAVCDYSQFVIRTAEIPFYFYVFKADLQKAETDFPVLTEMLKSHEHYFGPYPFAREKYGIAEFARESYREHQTIPSLGYNYITGLHSADRVLAHELAHQWFGNSLSVKNWRHIWLNESFCNYAYALWAEYKSGKTAYAEVMKKYDRVDFSGPVLLADSLNVDTMFTATTFCKGAWLLHMLRQVMGDEAFFAAIKEYVTVYRYKNVETVDFQQICERNCRHRLQWFFDEWLLGTGRPQYSASVTNRPGSETYLVSLSLTQEQKNDRIYSMPVNIRFILDNGKIIQKRFWNDLQKQTYRLKLSGPVARVVVDPEDDILKKAEPVSN